MDHCGRRGFTLIELSIVLVIIGLVIGGVLVGQDLISAAAVRAQVSQIEKYNTAVNTFRGKYNALPGDIPNAQATQFGFSQRGILAVGQYAGEGDGDGNGNGVIEGGNGCGFGLISGEALIFWSDLTSAGLIDGQFPNDTDNFFLANGPIFPGNAGNYSPAAKIGNDNYVLVWSGGYGNGDGTDSDGGTGATSYPLTNCGVSALSDGKNYYTILQWGFASNVFYTSQGLAVNQAYNIDKKMDDGLPQSGKVTVMYPLGNFNGEVGWSYGGGTPSGTGWYSAPSVGSGLATDGSGGGGGTPSLWCYDDSTDGTTNTASITHPMHYATEVNNGAGQNCALSLQFQ